MKRVVFGLLTVIALSSTAAHAEIVGKEVQYKAGDTILRGYLAYDNSSSRKRPGVLVVHEWWGQNDYARMRARKLAKLGYTAFALDMYGDGKQANHPKEAGAFSGEVKRNMPVAKERFLAAEKILSEHKYTDPTRIAAIGYCFGGGIVLEMARMGVDLKGVVSFHGSLGTASPARKGEVKAKVLVLNGAADPFTKPEQIQAFKQEMTSAGVDYRFISYPGAKHAFTNPAATENGRQFGLPLEYNKSADRKSWNEMKKFLTEVMN
jgi:dienelactone hydrolase